MTPAVRGLACIASWRPLAASPPPAAARRPSGDESPLTPGHAAAQLVPRGRVRRLLRRRRQGLLPGRTGWTSTSCEGGPGDPADRHRARRSGGLRRLLVRRAEGLGGGGTPAVAVMAAFQIPPLVIFSLSDSGITRPADLVGRRVGVTTDYWRDVLEQTLEAAGVDPPQSPPSRWRPTTCRPLYDGEVDAWLGYAQDEPIQAEIAGHPVTNIFPADYGVGGYEGLVLATEQTDRRRPGPRAALRAGEPAGLAVRRRAPGRGGADPPEWAPDAGPRVPAAGGPRRSAPLVDTPQAPIGWIDAARWQPADGGRVRPRPPRLHDGLLLRAALSARDQRSAGAARAVEGRLRAPPPRRRSRSGTGSSSTSCASWCSRPSPSARPPSSSRRATRTTAWSAS